ncbi:unnamed protein product, partial [Oppiella nova]
VSANDASPQIEKDRQSGQTTSYETASSQGSRYSSPPSVGHQTTDRNDNESNVSRPDANLNSKLMPNNTSLPKLVTEEELAEVVDPGGDGRTLSPESTLSTHNSTEHNVDDDF